MNSYGTLFMPDTDIYQEKYYPLLLFFSPLHYLRLLEGDAGGTAEADAELFVNRGLCKPYVPAPLGENRQNFTRLIDDLRARKEHYLSRLRTIAPDSVSITAEDRDGGVSALLQEFGIPHCTSELGVWRARLVLAMAEILASDEQAVQEEYAEQVAFFNEEITALRSTPEAKGTDEMDLLAKLENLMAELAVPKPTASLKRTEAWLHLVQNQPPPAVKIWLAATRDSGERIFTRYESLSQASAVPVLRLALPAYIDASGKYVIEIIEKFHRETAAIHHGLVADFDRLVATVPYSRESPDSLLPFGTDWAELWEGKLDTYFPAARDGRNHVTFYLLPGQPLTRLLSLPKARGGAEDAVHGLIAILGSSPE